MLLIGVDYHPSCQQRVRTRYNHEIAPGAKLLVLVPPALDRGEICILWHFYTVCGAGDAIPRAS
jgi:hypothetical protein